MCLNRLVGRVISMCLLKWLESNRIWQKFVREREQSQMKCAVRDGFCGVWELCKNFHFTHKANYFSLIRFWRSLDGNGRYKYRMGIVGSNIVSNARESWPKSTNNGFEGEISLISSDDARTRTHTENISCRRVYRIFMMMELTARRLKSHVSFNVESKSYRIYVCVYCVHDIKHKIIKCDSCASKIDKMT